MYDLNEIQVYGLLFGTRETIFNIFEKDPKRFIFAQIIV